MIVEDHAVVRVGLERLLAGVDDIDVVGAAPDGLQALELAESLRPDVILMDLVMPELDGREATRRIVAANPQVHIVVLTSFSDRELILEALDAGAVGYLLKDAAPDELISGIRAAARGESPLHPKAAHELVRARAARQTVELSPREREVLTLIARGYANKRIAQELGISERTVKTHATAIFRSLDVADRTQAALWAQRHGLA